MWIPTTIVGIVTIFSSAAYPFLEVVFEQHKCDQIVPLFDEIRTDCVSIIENTTGTSVLECFNNRILTSNHVMKFTDFMKKNVSQRRELDFQCELLVFATNSQDSVEDFLSPYGYGQIGLAKSQRFYPFTKILIIYDWPLAELHFSRNVFQYLITNALNVIWLNPNRNTEKGSVFYRVIFNDTIATDRFDSNIFEMEKFVDFLLKDELGLMEIRASFFNCPPFVLYPEDAQIPFDGVEYRCLQEISKNWKRENILRDYSDKIKDPWEAVSTDLKRNISDVAMCSHWTTINKYTHFSLSRYYDSQCTTFLVPKPRHLSQASLIYLPLDLTVWMSFVAILIITAILLHFFTYSLRTHMFQDLFGDVRFTNISTVLMDVINLATSHGLPRFSFHASLKLLVLGFMFFTLLLGTTYTTRYTSLLALPRFSKTIEHFRDFAESDVIWGELGERVDFLQEIRASGIAEHETLADKFIIEKSIEHRRELIKGKKYARLVKKLNNFVTETEEISDLALELRLMKECLFNHFTVFAFNYHSLYKRIFDRQITRFLESGILANWFRDMTILYGKSYMHHFFASNKMQSGEPKVLSVDNLIGAFILLVCGAIFSILVFSCEMVWSRILKYF